MIPNDIRMEAARSIRRYEFLRGPITGRELKMQDFRYMFPQGMPSALIYECIRKAGIEKRGEHGGKRYRIRDRTCFLRVFEAAYYASIDPDFARDFRPARKSPKPKARKRKPRPDYSTYTLRPGNLSVGRILRALFPDNNNLDPWKTMEILRNYGIHIRHPRGRQSKFYLKGSCIEQIEEALKRKYTAGDLYLPEEGTIRITQARPESVTKRFEFISTVFSHPGGAIEHPQFATVEQAKNALMIDNSISNKEVYAWLTRNGVPLTSSGLFDLGSDAEKALLTAAAETDGIGRKSPSWGERKGYKVHLELA